MIKLIAATRFHPAVSNPESQDWRYTLVLPNGKIRDVTNGEGSEKVVFCFGCHIAQGGATDSMTFLPEAYRR